MEFISLKNRVHQSSQKLLHAGKSFRTNRLRNAIQAKHRVVEVPASNLKKEITKILFEKGYILNYKFVEDGPQGTIKVALKYDPVNKVNAIKKLERISSPGLRQYTGYKDKIGRAHV